MPTLVSACLLGFPCRHDGGDKRDERVLDKLRGEELIPICPEVAAGFGIPRPPAWHDGNRVVDALGADVTAQFENGARQAVEAARTHGARLAILKQNSPSCGTLMTGTARGRAPGRGRAAAALAAAGVEVRGEDEL
ncbi:MAG: DUF523 domain-containing protein [Myxococcales bacterium]|nr:DUF523 domain-containing protein [Myxococcales bacterium]